MAKILRAIALLCISSVVALQARNDQQKMNANIYNLANAVFQLVVALQKARLPTLSQSDLAVILQQTQQSSLDTLLLEHREESLTGFDKK